MGVYPFPPHENFATSADIEQEVNGRKTRNVVEGLKDAPNSNQRTVARFAISFAYYSSPENALPPPFRQSAEKWFICCCLLITTLTPRAILSISLDILANNKVPKDAGNDVEVSVGSIPQIWEFCVAIPQRELNQLPTKLEL